MMIKIEQLYDALRAPLLAFIKQKIKDDTKAEDLLHDVFLKVQEQMGSVKDLTKLESWIYRIARNAIADEYRKTKPTESLDVSEYEGRNDFAEEADESVIERLSDSVYTFLAQVPEPYRTALILSDLENLAQEEIAWRLNLSLSGAKSRIQRARKMLKELYVQCCSFEQNRFGTVLGYEPKSEPCLCEP
jgi:RNA polymerase sigma-70 factor (ECF subfamily)